MKRSFYGLLGLLVLAANFVLVTPAFATTQRECEEAGYHWYTSKSWCYSDSISDTSTSRIDSWVTSCKSKGGEEKIDNNMHYCVINVNTHGGGNGGGGNNGGNSGGNNGGGSGTNNGGGSGSGSGTSDSGGGSPTVVSTGSTVSTNKCGGVATSLISCSDSSDGSAIFEILGIGLTIVTYGVGAAAVLGVVITGYQYMSARDNAAQVVKAKNRLLQVVIGLAIWVLFWGVLQFLLPGGLFANGS